MLTILKKGLFLGVVGILANSALAQDGVMAPSVPQEEVVLPLEQRLFQASRDPNIDFEAVRAEALEAGVSEVELLIPTMINSLTTRDLERAKALFSDLEAAADVLEFGMGNAFGSRTQFLGFVETAKAVVAFQEDDISAFEEHAAKAFVKSPELVRGFGIDQMMIKIRQDELQAEVLSDASIPMDMIVASVEGESKTLKEWMGDDKALLIDFWASWCGPCIRLMPELKHKSERLGAQGIAVVAMNTDDGAGQKEAAVGVQEKQSMESVTWLLDNNGGELSSLLYIDTIPRMVLVSPEGNILYNGHPQDPSLGVALAKLDVTLETVQ